MLFRKSLGCRIQSLGLFQRNSVLCVVVFLFRYVHNLLIEI